MIRGNDKRPYIEVTDHEEAQESRLAKAAQYAALSTLAFFGVRWAGSNITFRMNPQALSYLHEGLSTANNPWWQVAGLQESGELHQVRLKDIALEGVKRTEEIMGGIPRTFGAFGFLSKNTFTSPTSSLVLTPEDLTGAWSHYETLVENAGNQITHMDRARGLVVQPYQASPDHARTPALFRIDDSGAAIGDPLVRDVTISVRRWGPDGVPEQYRQIIRDTDIISESMGAERIRHDNNFPFVVTKAEGKVRITGALRSTLEAFGSVDALENRVNAYMTPQTHEALREGHVLAKRMSERYMRVLDQPLEFIDELIYGGPNSEKGILKKAADSKAYGFMRNLLGTGGNYSGTAYDLWARHAGRLAIAAVGVAAAYEAGSLVTGLLFGRDIAQVGGEIVGGTERLLAGVSDLTGMTALNQAQEEAADGSGRFLGVLAFPLSGYITGHVAAGLTTRTATPTGELPWRTARQVAYEIPEALRPAGNLPVVGKYFSGQKTRGGVWGAVGMAVGGLLSLPFLPGSLGSSESYDEVVAKHRGEVEVEVRKGANWEMGRTDIEGDAIQYYRPGWFRRLQDDAFDDLQFGDLGDRPFSRMVKSLYDPNWREKEFYHERPYPVTGPDTTGMGPLGTLWGMTVGRVLKNPSYMHEDELSGGGHKGVAAGEVVQFGRGLSEAPDASLGGLGPAPVVSPYDQSFLAGEGAYKLTEAIGLPGFTLTAIKKAITGEQDWGTEEPVLASFADMGSFRDNFWSMNLGGGYGTTEGIRRLIPNERFQLQEINPIANEMPSWMPGPEYYEDFRHGDPYAAIAEGEYRLPGSGYAARFTELEGVKSEDYPLIHRYKILGDVAPYSRQFKDVREEVESLARSGGLSGRERMIYEGTEIQLDERSRKVRFAEDEGIIGGYWSALKKIGRANPVEHLIPISPVHKLAGALDPISEYESREIYGTASPSWSEPVSDFVLPALANAARFGGYDGVPPGVQSKRDIKGYFDKLEYTKYKTLEAQARGEGEGKAAFAYSRKAEYTMYGADPYGDVDTVMRVLPTEERAYFRDFVAAETPREKGRILEIVPEYTRKFYTAQWQKQIYGALAAKGNLSGEEQRAVQYIESVRALEGESASPEMWSQYQRGVSSGRVRPNTFPDYIRAQRLGGYFEDEAPFGAPPTDWLGYDPGVAMDDVKLKVVQDLGMDHHDFGIWEDDVAAARRKPYLNTAAEDLMHGSAQDSDDLIRTLTALKIRDLDVQIIATGGDKTRVTFEVGEDRTGQLRSQLERQGVRYGV